MSNGGSKMLKDIAGIKLCGANYAAPTELLLFDPIEGTKEKYIKGTILYGRNGAGKSTISKAIRKYKGEEDSHISQAVFIDKNGAEVALSEEEKEAVFVFDEKYIDDNVRIQEDGLETIVMLGSQIGIEDEINELNDKYEEQKGVCDRISEQLKILTNKNNLNAPEYWRNKMKESLQGNDNWAGRDKRIKGNIQNTGVNEGTYKRFLSKKPKENRDGLILAFEEKMQELEKAKSGEQEIKEKVPQLKGKFDFNKVSILLQEKIEKPVLSEREQYLLGLCQEHKSHRVEEIKSVFTTPETVRCPFCFQAVSSEYKWDLIKSIEKVLSKQVEEHKEKLQGAILDSITIDLRAYEKLGETYRETCDSISKLNSEIQAINAEIIKKHDDPYETIVFEAETAENLYVKVAEMLAKLEEARLKYNISACNTDEIIKQLHEINEQIAFYDIKEKYDKYVEKDKELNQKTESLQKEHEREKKLKEKLGELNEKRKNTRIALSQINNCLKYIFFSDNRLKIENRDDRYYLLSNGCPVKPNQISVGERNILGLCYYFTTMFQNKEISKVHEQEYLLIIDDPVSSFDMENKVGIMSFLKFQLSRYLTGNKNTRVMITTHDIMVCYDLQKIMKEINEGSKQIWPNTQISYKTYELKNSKLNDFINKRNEYSELIKQIYQFAQNTGQGDDIVIGNIMRQVLEAFSTFEYKKSIEEVTTDSVILKLLPEEHRSYFENLMYRLVLHGGSHREEQIKALEDLNFYEFITIEEKRRTARDILCFLYLVNKEHLIAHIGRGKKIETDLEQWCNEIKNRSCVLQ